LYNRTVTFAISFGQTVKRQISLNLIETSQKTERTPVFESFPYKEFCKIVTAATVDKYVKKLKIIKPLYLLIVAQIMQIESLKDLADTIALDKDLQTALHLTSTKRNLKSC
jgi:hypothetical protein